MTDVQRIQSLYELSGSYRQVAREMHISRNTVRKYLRQIDEVREGTRSEILPSIREINQPRHIVTDEIISLIHSLLESNQIRPKKQRLNAQLSDLNQIQRYHRNPSFIHRDRSPNI